MGASSPSSVADPKARGKVLAQIEAMQDEIVRLLSDTVKIRSVNPNYPGAVREEELGGETKVNEFLKPVLESFGMKTTFVTKEKGRSNLVGVYTGTGGGKSLHFNGHVDVVPSGDLAYWTEAGPWSGEVKHDRVYGRGAMDMKGGNAACIKALEAVLRAGYRPLGDVIISQVAGEEAVENDVGIGAVLEAGFTGDAGVVVEPSSPPSRLAICPANSGLLLLQIDILGKSGHIGLRDELVRAGGKGAEVGVNSIEKSLIVMEAMRKLEEEWGQTKNHPAFSRPGHFTINPGKVTGGPSGAFVFSELSTIQYAIWTNPDESLDQVLAEIAAQIKRFADTDPWLRENQPTMQVLKFLPPYNTPLDHPIVQAAAAAYQAAMNEPADIGGFTAGCDGTPMYQVGMPVVLIGPGHLSQAHQANEYCEISELIDATKIYAMTILEWCGCSRA